MNPILNFVSRVWSFSFLQLPSYKAVASEEGSDNESTSTETKDDFSNRGISSPRDGVNARYRALRCAIVVLAACVGAVADSFYHSHVAALLNRGGFVPNMPLTAEPVIFRPDPPHFEAIWQKLIEPGFANFAVTDPERFHLSPGVTLPEEDHIEMYSLSMFHQLHCLGMIRKALYHSAEDEEQDAEKQMQEAHHIRHCFSFLRQGIMCSADLTVEGSRVEADDGKRVQTDGWGVAHRQCKDLEAIWDFLEENKYFNSHGEIVYHRKHHN